MLTNLINGDCLVELPKMPDDCVDCVITSPPYNLKGLRGGKNIAVDSITMWKQCNIPYEDNLTEAQYQEQQITLLNELYRVIKPTGSIFYNHKVRRTKAQAHHPWQWIGKAKTKFYQQIIWDRKSSPNQALNFLVPSTELIFWLTKDKPKVFKSKVSIKGEVWSIAPAKEKYKGHPPVFPDLLIEQCINLTTQTNDVVMDCYMGLGSVGMVCKKMWYRDFVGIELNKEYYETAKKRLEE